MSFVTNPLASKKSNHNSSSDNIGGSSTLSTTISSDHIASIPLVDASSFPTSGTIKINDEYITYTSKSNNDLSGTITRGAFNTTAIEQTINSSVSGVFVGTSELNNQPDAKIIVKSNTSGTLYIDFSSNNSDWNSYPTNGLLVSANKVTTLKYSKGNHYFRVRFLNNSSSQATSFNIHTCFGLFEKSNQYMGSEDTWTASEKNLSIIGAVRNDTLSSLASSDDQFAPLQVDEKGGLYGIDQIYDLEMNARAHVSHFGALKTSGTYPIVNGNFPGYVLDPTKWKNLSVYGGFILVGNGIADICAGTNPRGKAKLISKLDGIFEAGQVSVYQSGVLPGLGITNGYKRWGLVNQIQCSALFFEWASKSFYVIQGHVQSATSTTIVFSGQESSTNDIYNDEYEVHILDGAGYGQIRQITDYDGSTKTATINTAWHSPPDSTSRYLLGGFIQSGTSTTAVLAGAESSTDDAYNDYVIIIYSGKGQGQYRTITDYTGSTKTITVPEWNTIPDTTSRYFLFGLVQSATSTTITFSNAESNIDDAYNDDYDVVLASGSGAGQRRTITDYTSSRVATVSSWTDIPNTDVFQVVARRIYMETAVTSANFNGLVWTPTTKNNTFRIHYSAGRALFQRASAGKIITLHTLVNTSVPLVSNLNLGLLYEVGNIGNTTEHFIRVRGASQSIFGNEPKRNDRYVFETTNSLDASESVSSGLLDLEGYSQIQLEIYSDVSGTLTGKWYDNRNQTTLVKTTMFPYTSLTLESFSSPTLTRYLDITYTNSSTSQSSFMLRVKILTKAVSSQLIGLTTTIVSDMTASLNRSVTMGQQPDGDYVNLPADGSAFSTTANLGGSTAIDNVSGITASDTAIDVDDTTGFPSSGNIKIDDEYINYTGTTSTTFTGCTRGVHSSTATTHNDNSIVYNCYVSPWVDSDGWNTIQLFVKSNQRTTINGVILNFTDDTQAQTPILRGEKKFTYDDVDVSRGYRIINIKPVLDGFQLIFINQSVTTTGLYIDATLKVSSDQLVYNEAQALNTGDFLTEVALGKVSNYAVEYKLGRNPDVDTGVSEDIWENGGTYTGDSSETEIVRITSSNSNDTSAGNGARTMRIVGLKTSTSTNYDTEDITLNGTSNVLTSNSWYRINKAYVLTAGNNGSNQGTITIRHHTTSGNIFGTIETGLNQTSVGVYTVPAQNTLLIKKIVIGISRANGSAGSAYITLRVRESGGVYRVVEGYDLQTGAIVTDKREGGIKIHAGSDIKFTVESVSDNNTIANVTFEYILINT